MRCPAEAYFRYHLGLVPKGQRQNPDLFFGTAVHKAIEIGLAEGRVAALNYLEGLLWPPSKTKTKKAAIILVTSLLRADLPFTPQKTEQSFKIPLGKHTVAGRFDIVGQSKNGTIIADHKTTAPAYLVTKPNTQFILYSYAAKKLYEDFDRFWVINLDPNLCTIKTIPVYYSDAEMEQWQASIMRYLDYLESEFEQGFPFMHDSCIRFYKHFCSYHDICTASESVREKIISGCFEINTDLRDLTY